MYIYIYIYIHVCVCMASPSFGSRSQGVGQGTGRVSRGGGVALCFFKVDMCTLHSGADVQTGLVFRG